MPTIPNISMAYGGRKAFCINSADGSVTITRVDTRDRFGVDLTGVVGGGIFTLITNEAELIAFANTGGLGCITANITVNSADVVFNNACYLIQDPATLVTITTANIFDVDSNYVWLDGVRIQKTHNTNEIVLTDGYDYFTMSNCELHRTVASGVFPAVRVLGHGDEIMLVGNYIHNNAAAGGDGIVIHDCKYVFVLDNYIDLGDSAGTSGIYVRANGAEYVEIIGNIVTDCAQSITVGAYDVIHLIINNNICEGSGYGMILQQTLGYAQISGNVLRNNTVNGLRLIDTSYNNCTGNTAYNNGGADYEDAGTAGFNNYSGCVSQNVAAEYVIAGTSINVGSL